ncbi:hypothetical protein DU002_00220 [Corallincola holothuriorum]|uniref:Sulfurtransferase complex subunit TusB n=1 Tax=Corallincola holothuriorum TaxID=2282215 RepID=A0A368NRJ2_9GAMM|nr:DsrH/TusB family sulfur metabolism protein [Corallincola holothuriorum]RCU52435.1 hypothetical protein DU002_00220 [Corallincola holothuriorum]
MKPLIILSEPLPAATATSLPSDSTLLLRAEACLMLHQPDQYAWLTQHSGECLVLADDATARGVRSGSQDFHLITMDEMVDLTLTHQPVISW